MEQTWRSERLLYRPFEVPADDEFLTSVYNDPEVFINSNYFLPRPWSAADLSEARKDIVSASLLFVVVCKIPESKSVSAADDDKATGDDKEKEGKKLTPIPVGFISLRKPPSVHAAHHRSSEIGITIAKEHHGSGYGPEAIKWILSWGFRMAGLHRIGLKVFEYNTKAQKLYKALGFIDEGREREGLWYDGKWWDIISMGILDHEWEKLQKGSA